MEDTTNEGFEYTPEQLIELAKNEPLKWLELFMEENGLS